MLYWGLIVEMSVSVLFQTASAVPLCAVKRATPRQLQACLFEPTHECAAKSPREQTEVYFVRPVAHMAHISAIELRKLLMLSCRAFDFRLSLLWSNCTCYGAICSPCRVYVQFLG